MLDYDLCKARQHRQAIKFVGYLLVVPIVLDLQGFLLPLSVEDAVDLAQDRISLCLEELKSLTCVVWQGLEFGVCDQSELARFLVLLLVFDLLKD